MRNNRILMCVAMFVGVFSFAFAEKVWLFRATVNVPKTGLVETVLPPELHVAMKTGGSGDALDITLLGPDFQPRAFELFWREKTENRRLVLKADKIELRDDHKLVWEGTVPEKFSLSRILSSIAGSSITGKVDVEVCSNSVWIKLAENSVLQKSGKSDVADIPCPEGEYQKVRLSFSGYDQSFMATPVFIESVSILGKGMGKDYVLSSFKPVMEETLTENNLEIRVTLPGSGIWIDELEINTEALFQGTWQLGLESIVLGKREFENLRQGEATIVDKDRQKLRIRIGQRWPARTLILKLASPSWFGRTLDCQVSARMPRMIFMADQPGSYTIQAGLENPVAVLDTASRLDRQADFELSFSAAETNSSSRPENLLQKYSIRGGPFNPEGYAWKAPVRLEEPGFYRLILNEKACFEENRHGFRLVRDQTQIPFFLGGLEIRGIPLPAESVYEADRNRSVLNIRLPAPSSSLHAIQLSASGIFERNLVIEKHKTGEAGWQPWLTKRWINTVNGPSWLSLPLSDFPADQNEIRITIDHGNNQPLKIDEIHASYLAQDIFFLATASGPCELFGGNQVAQPAIYDLAIIQRQLFDLVPRRTEMGQMEPLQGVPGQAVSSGTLGGPFDGSGYTWMASFSVPVSGFYQLALNQHASLEENRPGIRIVRNSLQVPYFAGKSEVRKVELKVVEDYEKSGNKTNWLITLPGPSSHWSELIFTARGVFERHLSFEIRKPGKLGWKPWQSRTWTGRSENESEFSLDLNTLPKGETEVRLVMSHGDNSPLQISRIQAAFVSQDFFFFAGEAGEYSLAGGNRTAHAPAYDLELIKNHLLKGEPAKIAMGEIREWHGQSLKTRLDAVFSEQGWGLYIVLGMVTLILLLIIVRLFPKAQEAGQAKKEDKD